MMAKQYEKEVLRALLSKYQKRIDEGKDASVRRIFLNPASICQGYGSRNTDMQDKNNFDYAVEKCAQNGFLFYEKKSGSALIDRIWLNPAAVNEIENYLLDYYGIQPAPSLWNEFQTAVKKNMKGPLTSAYGNTLLLQNAHQLKKEEAALAVDVIHMLGFLEQNKKNLYIREASMLVYGSSKYFEEPMHMSAVCRAIRDIDHASDLYDEKEDLVLEKYHVYNVEQEIRLKGRLILHFRDADIDVGKLADGIAISSADMNSLLSIEVNATGFMTVENKTSFERYCDDQMVFMYLGGYASRHQTAFIKKVYEGNQELQYLHFGDIDAGGLKIHQNLCRVTGIHFAMFHMGSSDLNDPRYASCLQKLTDHDLANLQSIENLPEYADVISTMKKRGKLEQEIISFFLSK